MDGGVCLISLLVSLLLICVPRLLISTAIRLLICVPIDRLGGVLFTSLWSNSGILIRISISSSRICVEVGLILEVVHPVLILVLLILVLFDSGAVYDGDVDFPTILPLCALV